MLARILSLTLPLLFSVHQVLAATPEKDDFAYGFEVIAEGNDAVYSLPLPADVYANSVAPDLKDIRIFNAAGELVPHEFRYAESVLQPIQRTVEIPFYPLSSGRGAADEDIYLEIRRSINGEIISIERKGSSIQLPAFSYLLDMVEAGPYPLTLRLTWKSNDTGFMLPVEVEESADLSDWKQLKKATLADLEFMNMKLLHQEIFLSKNPERYIRLIFGVGGKAIQLTGVQAVSGQKQEQAKRSWLSLPLQEIGVGEDAVMEAELGGSVPVDRLQVEFPQANALLHAEISTRTVNMLWQVRTDALFYELLENGIVLQNEPVHLSRENISTIRLKPLEDSAVVPLDSLKLQIGFIPHDLLFIAQGSGPYVLAYGNVSLQGEGSDERVTDIHGLAGEKKQSIVNTARVGEKIVLGGETRLAMATGSPWQTMTIWLVLVLSIGTIVVLIWSTVRRRR